MAFKVEVSALDTVAIISPTSVEFDALVTSLLGRLAERALRLKPYLAIVRNQSPRTIVAFTSEWISFPNEYGAITTARSHVAFPDAVCGPALGRSVQQGIPPDGQMVISVTCSVERESLESDDGKWLDPFVQEKDSQLANATDLRIGLDAVIFDDGVLVGPDTTGLARGFWVHVDAKQEIYRTLTTRLEECSASEDFFAPVRAMLVNPRNAGPQVLRDPADRARSHAAAEVIGWQRRTLLHSLKAARTESFLIRRREKSGGE